MPKHRTTIYVVVRETTGQLTVLDSFYSYEAATNRAAECQQEFEDRGIFDFTFDVKSSTYYEL